MYAKWGYISFVTILVTLLITTHEPPSGGGRGVGRWGSFSDGGLTLKKGVTVEVVGGVGGGGELEESGGSGGSGGSRGGVRGVKWRVGR